MWACVVYCANEGGGFSFLITDPPRPMRIRSEFDIPDHVLRLLRLHDTSPTHTYVEPHTVIRRHPISGATATILVYEMNGDLYRVVSAQLTGGLVTDDGYSLVSYEPDDYEDVLDDYGARYAKQKKTAPSNLAGRPTA